MDKKTERYVEFSFDDYLRFRQMYEIAVAEKLEVFVFNGDEYLAAYAKYVVEYLEDFFREKTN